jgi:membrane-associated phospholipid phosphatase
MPLAAFFRLDHSHPVYLVARYLTKYGEAQYFLVPALILGTATWRKWPQLSNRAWYVFWCVASSGIAVTLIKMLLGRARPGMYFREGIHGFHFFETDADFLSFPSGHSTVFFAGFLSLAMLMPRWRVHFALLAAAFSFTRVLTGVHFLSDVIAGAMLATLFCVLLKDRILGMRAQTQAAGETLPAGSLA